MHFRRVKRRLKESLPRAEAVSALRGTGKDEIGYDGDGIRWT